MVKFMIVKSRKPNAKQKFLIIKNGKIVGRTSQIALDLRPTKIKRKKRK